MKLSNWKRMQWELFRMVAFIMGIYLLLKWGW